LWRTISVAGCSPTPTGFPLGTGLFFAFLITLVASFYDVYRPVYEARSYAQPRDRDTDRA
jgi:hypothetical protein